MTVLSLDALVPMRHQWRHNGQCLVLTNGIFDLLHSGHVRYLEQARQLGDVLVVGVNSDASTRVLKGPHRPLVPEHERAYLLSALRWVDYVTLFSERTADVLVETLQPDIYVKGGDYAQQPDEPNDMTSLVVDDARLPEARVVRAYNGQVVLLPYEAGLSTTELIRKIRG